MAPLPLLLPPFPCLGSLSFLLPLAAVIRAEEPLVAEQGEGRIGQPFKGVVRIWGTADRWVWAKSVAQICEFMWYRVLQSSGTRFCNLVAPDFPGWLGRLDIGPTTLIQIGI